MENILILNMDRICRVCLTENDDMHSIFSELTHEDNLEDSNFAHEILMNISNLKIKQDDGLPSLICSACLGSAHSCFNFLQKCNRSQEILQDYVSHISLNENKDIELDGAINEETIMDKDLEERLNTSDVDEDVLKEEIVEFNFNSHSDESDNESLDAVKIAASDENVELRLKLALKKKNTASNESIASGRSKYNYYKRINPDGETVYACNICKKTYKFGHSLKIHIETHTDERPFKCNLCQKAFKLYSSLRYHLRTHTGLQPYSCKLCGKSYRQSGSLTAHMRIHTGQRPFLCSICGKGFRQAPDLTYHMRTHTKEKPYMCSVCGKTMAMQCHLVQHMRIHTGEKPYKCELCEKAFASSTRLKRHTIIHTDLKPFKCEVCSKSFNRASTLRVHEKIHTQDRPHICPVCGKRFIQPHTLKGHVLTHSTTSNSN